MSVNFNSTQKKTITVIIGIIVFIGLVFGGLYATRNVGKTGQQISADEASTTFDSMYSKIAPTTAKPVKSSLDSEDQEDDSEELPDISKHELSVKATTDDSAEIWASGEKADKNSSSKDGWMTKMAEDFNASNPVIDGKRVSVSLRSMTSGQSIDYISSGKASPDAYSPSSMLFVKMLNDKGTETETVAKRTVGNVAGVVLKNDVYKQLESEYGTVDLNAITKSVSNGSIQFGYTNPFTSATGMNFLISTLQRYDRKDPLSDTAKDGFKSFQSNIPLVSMTTQQMRNAADRDSLDGFVTELQVYENDPDLKKSYKFAAFGYRHDNPLVTVGNTGNMQKKIVKEFADYCDKNGGELAEKNGFNKMNDYKTELDEPSGKTLVSAQKLYKENKNAGNETIAVFVTDTSGSMAGDPMNALQKSLINGMKYINSDSYVGLVSYNDTVTINVPIAKFDMTQKSLFKGGVKSLRAEGGTATFDGIAVAGKMISDAVAEHPNARVMMFVLSDGETNMGYSLDDIREPVKGLHIPIYTIGYNADISALQQISDISEATSINADTDDVTYQIKTLFNANL